MRDQPLTRRAIQVAPGARRGLLALVIGAMLLLVAACGGSGSGSGKGTSGQAGTDLQQSQAVVTVSPNDGATNVATSGVLKVSASQGRLSQVTVTDSQGNAVPGSLSAGDTSWSPSENLSAGTKYSVNAVARDAQGRQTAKHVTFTTVVPQGKLIGYFNVDPGATYGVGMEVSLNFTEPVTDEKTVQDAISVTANPSVPVAGHWFGNQRLDFRPQSYWAPGTQVTLHLRLNGVEGAPGYYGVQSKDVSFSIGRGQVSYVNAATHMMQVTQNGRTIKSVPITAGGPGHDSWNGQMVISEKDLVTRMNSETVGLGGEYNIGDVPHAMRLTSSGTFIHGNYWADSSVFGSANTSHGCVSMQDVKGAGDPNTPAAWFFDNSMIGDVVVVSHSASAQVQPDNGLNGWNMPWSEWTAGN